MIRDNISTTSLILVTRDDCRDCLNIKLKLKNILSMNSKILLKEYDINDFNNMNLFSKQIRILITPALFVNNRLKLYGDMPSEQLEKIITGN